LHEVAAAAGVDKGNAKDIFVVLVFGGSIDTWKEEYNVFNDASLPNFAYNFEIVMKICGAQFNADPKYFMYGHSAQTRKHHSKRRWKNSAFALWLQDQEASA
jgi:hypothetical protein